LELTQTERLVQSLAAQLQPVRRLRPPAQRAAAWLAVVATVLLVAILCFANLGVFVRRMSSPRTALECAATALTAITAVIAAFEVSVPDGSPRWAWLPLPSLLVWLGAGGLGCLRNGVSLHGPDGPLGDSPSCFSFIAGLSVPLAAGLFWMLRRARPIAPLPVALLGTLGVAATAAFVLQFFHPFDVTVIDLSLHLGAIGLVIAVGAALRRPLLSAQ
jgi:hypothetical protein